MAPVLRLLFSTAVLFFFFQECYGQPCTQSNISISQTKTGNLVAGQPEYEVVITNNCVCVQVRLLLHCTGFTTVKPVDPAIFKPVDNGNCLVISGNSVGRDPISFTYASNTPTELSVASSEIACS